MRHRHARGLQKANHGRKNECSEGLQSRGRSGLPRPEPVFNPDGFDFPVTYYRDDETAQPIPEFRVYAQQLLTLLAIVLITHRKFLPQTAVIIECRVEIAGEGLKMVLIAKVSLSSESSSSSETAPLQMVGAAFSMALRSLFPKVEKTFWDRELNTGHTKLWMKYPGGMTQAGFLKTTEQQNSALSWTARAEIPYPDDAQYLRSVAVLDFIVDGSAREL